MLASVQGIYHHGQVRLREQPATVPEETPVIVTFLGPGDVDLRAPGLDEAQAGELGARVAPTGNPPLAPALAPQTQEPDLAPHFHELAEQWRRETSLLSNLHKKVIHPAYQRIIGLGPRAIPHILGELKRTRGHWLWALNAITGEDPAPSGATFSEAVDAWLGWGKANGYL